MSRKNSREIISTTAKNFHVCSKQHGDIRHAIGKVKYDVDGTFLYSLNLLTLILCERIVPHQNIALAQSGSQVHETNI